MLPAPVLDSIKPSRRLFLPVPAHKLPSVEAALVEDRTFLSNVNVILVMSLQYPS